MINVAPIAQLALLASLAIGAGVCAPLQSSQQAQQQASITSSAIVPGPKASILQQSASLNSPSSLGLSNGGGIGGISSGNSASGSSPSPSSSSSSSSSSSAASTTTSTTSAPNNLITANNHHQNQHLHRHLHASGAASSPFAAGPFAERERAYLLPAIGGLNGAASLISGASSLASLPRRLDAAGHQDEQLDTFDGRNPFTDDSLWRIPVQLVRDLSGSSAPNERYASGSSSGASSSAGPPLNDNMARSASEAPANLQNLGSTLLATNLALADDDDDDEADNAAATGFMADSAALLRAAGFAGPLPPPSASSASSAPASAPARPALQLAPAPSAPAPSTSASAAASNSAPDLKAAADYHYPSSHGAHHEPHGYGHHELAGHDHHGHHYEPHHHYSHQPHAGAYGGADAGHYGKYFQYASVPYPYQWEFGYRRGNPYHTIERYEHGKGPHFQTKVKWNDKYGGYGVQVWDYNHDDHHGHHYGADNHYDSHAPAHYAGQHGHYASQHGPYAGHH